MATKDESARYGHNSGSGSNEPKQHEKKEQRSDWVHRQGGDQTRPGDGASRPDDGGLGSRRCAVRRGAGQGDARRAGDGHAATPRGRAPGPEVTEDRRPADGHSEVELPPPHVPREPAPSTITS